MTQRPSRLLFVRNDYMPFIRTDRDLLAERFPVTDCYLKRWRELRPKALLESVIQHDVVMCWFASWHSVLPMLFARLLRKPSILVIGGYDTANLPEIGYGHQRGGPRRWATLLSVRLALELITHSEYTRQEALGNLGGAANQLQVVPLGVPDRPLPQVSREPNLVITTGNVNRSNLARKGLLPFVQAAALLPECSAVVIGEWIDDAIELLHHHAPANVRFTGRLEDSALLDFYARSAVYVQASAHEGFGLAVAEAMLAGTIPVVTRAGSLPEVVGDCGVYAASQSPADVAQGIKEALAWPATAGQRARERVLAQFPIERRRQALHQLVERLLA